MPKSAKKRREKAADFSKAKLKLGKGKQTPTNAIDTSFKARSIALPTQSIAVEKDDSEPTTRRRLTFDDLLAHIKHYSAGTRKEAILGLRELLEAHPELLDSCLAALINACVRIVGDEDASVRKVLLAFFAWLLPQVPPESLIPHSPLLLLFTTSAQTHIFPEIRIDAIRFLNVFLEHIPGTIVTGWSEGGGGHGNRVLEGYLGILNAGTKFGETDGPMKATSTASVVLTPASKLVVLQSLSTFLHSALASPHGASANSSINPGVIPMNAWYLASSFTSTDAYEAFDRLLQPHLQHNQRASSSRCWKAQVDLDDDFIQSYPFAFSSSDSPCTLHQLSEVINTAGGVADPGSSRSLDVAFVAHLTRTLHSTLISTFLDWAPTVFLPSGNPPETEVNLIVAVAEITRSLYRAILQGSTLDASHHDQACEGLKTILGYMGSYFPFRSNGNRDIKLEQTFQDLNLIYCELTSLLTLASQTQSSTRLRDTRRGKSRQANKRHADSQDSLSIQTKRVRDYVIQLLEGEPMSGSQLGRPLTPTAYIALLPTIWSLLDNPTTSHRELSGSILLATLEHAMKASSKSALKKPTIEFVARIVLLETEVEYEGGFRLGRCAIEDKKFEEWINHLPQTLWELGSNNLPATEVILRFLLRALQRKSKLVHPETITTLRSRLIPYFSITHAVRGQVLGPWSKLPASALRRLALDIVATILSPSWSHSSDAALGRAVNQAVAGTEERSYWEHLIEPSW